MKNEKCKKFEEGGLGSFQTVFSLTTTLLSVSLCPDLAAHGVSQGVECQEGC